MPLLFTYGTLQQESVQQARFGRVLSGRPDVLPGHRLEWVQIHDPAVVAVSGIDRHPIAIPAGPDAGVDGVVLEVTSEDLRSADDYEVDDYVRREVVLTSGRRAWVYLAPMSG